MGSDWYDRHPDVRRRAKKKYRRTHGEQIRAYNKNYVERNRLRVHVRFGHELKTCGRCHAQKPFNDFHGHSGTPDGKSGFCKDCTNRRRRDVLNPRHRERTKLYGVRRRNLLKRESPETYRAMVRRNNLKAAYGITPEEYDRLAEKQQGKCAICGVVPAGRLHIDHCHKTEKVRGLLCAKCNMAIGLLEDNPIVIRAAAEYLEGVFLCAS